MRVQQYKYHPTTLHYTGKASWVKEKQNGARSRNV